jgi:enamine deaminase RidA (YjgF/YER057c/UK114 family)
MALHVEADRFFGQRRPPSSIIPSDFSRSVRTIEGFPPDSTHHHSELIKLHLTSAGAGQAFLVAQATWGADAAAATRAAYDEIARVLQDQGLSMVHERLFGSLNVKAEVISARNASFRACGFPADGPLTYIQGTPPWGEGFAGVIIQAVSGDAVWTIEDEGKKVGTGWRRGDTTFLVLQNLQGLTQNGNGANGPTLQTKRLIQRAAHLLEAEGTSYRDVVRTWFYLSDILAWYPEFNRARTGIYEKFGILPGQDYGRLRLPASTGIRGEVPGGAVAAMDLLAVAGPAKSRPLVRQLSNKGQQDAFRYGSAFSRGALIRQSDLAMIQVSGTAAIDEQGRSLYPGDVRGQIDCTFDKVAALIGQEGASLQDIAAACVFVKRPEDALIYQERARALGIDFYLPAVVMVADICRPELLFEIDAEVIIAPSRRGHE